MADQADREARTEDPTPKRREEAREGGQVALSTELVTALALLGWLGTIAFAGDSLAGSLGAAIRAGLRAVGDHARGDLSVAESVGMVRTVGWSVGQVALLAIAPMFALGWLASYGQVGFVMAPKAIAFDAGKLDPMRGAKKLFGARAFVRAALSAVKLLVIAATMASIAWGQRARIAALGDMELGPMLAALGHIALRCTAGAIAAVILLALIDVFFQRVQHERDLRMTKQEVREEMKATEGDPHIKSRIRRVQREFARRRMMSEVPKATVVVTNPTHYAVALRYDRDRDAAQRGAPRVVAKGVDAIALKIREIARDAGVIVYEEPPLARALHAQCEIGDEVPVELYQAVASVLAYVYRVRGIHAPA
jgi:flagellar biosynthetic protein FlhB